MEDNQQTGELASTSMRNSRLTICVFIHPLPEWDVWLGAVDAAEKHGVNLIGVAGKELQAPGFDFQSNVLYDLVSPVYQ